MDKTTVLLTGMLPLVLNISAVLTAATSWLILWLYRRRVLLGMSRLQGWQEETTAASGSSGAAIGGPELLVHELSLEDQSLAASSLPTMGRSSQAMRAVALIYALAGLAFAVVFTGVWMVTAGGGFSIGRFVFLTACHLFPVVLAVSLAVATTNQERLYISGTYSFILVAVIWYVVVQNSNLTISEVLLAWFYSNVEGSILLFFFLHPRFRSIGPLVLVFMISGVASSFLSTEMLSRSEPILRLIDSAGSALGLKGTTLLVVLHVLSFPPLGLLGWLLLLQIGKRYRAKRLSDQSLTIDSLWLLFALVNSIELVFEGWQWIFTGLLAFAAYKTTTIAGFRLMARSSKGSAGAPMLLLLRVFALGRRSERFFDAFSKKWRYHGSILLISGPDLMTKTVEPHEILDFVSGRLAQQFVKNTDDLERQIAALDRRPDPDGRFRVNEFFCHADTWQMTMRRLANVCKAILMDLRGFTQENQGCLYELEQLLLYVDLGRVVFLVDSTTDRVFLEETLHRLWLRVDRTSPNRASSSPTVRLFPVMDQQRQAMNRLQTMLLEAQTAA